jgi:hypothetical protein
VSLLPFASTWFSNDMTLYSNARSDNAGRNPDEEWAKIKKPDGSESRLWPANRQTLWGYDGSLSIQTFN